MNVALFLEARRDELARFVPLLFRSAGSSTGRIMARRPSSGSDRPPRAAPAALRRRFLDRKRWRRSHHSAQKRRAALREMAVRAVGALRRRRYAPCHAYVARRFHMRPARGLRSVAATVAQRRADTKQLQRARRRQRRRATVCDLSFAHGAVAVRGCDSRRLAALFTLTSLSTEPGTWCGHAPVGPAGAAAVGRRLVPVHGCELSGSVLLLCPTPGAARRVAAWVGAALPEATARDVSDRCYAMEFVGPDAPEFAAMAEHHGASTVARGSEGGGAATHAVWLHDGWFWPGTPTSADPTVDGPPLPHGKDAYRSARRAFAAAVAAGALPIGVAERAALRAHAHVPVFPQWFAPPSLRRTPGPSGREPWAARHPTSMAVPVAFPERAAASAKRRGLPLLQLRAADGAAAAPDSDDDLFLEDTGAADATTAAATTRQADVAASTLCPLRRPKAVRRVGTVATAGFVWAEGAVAGAAFVDADAAKTGAAFAVRGPAGEAVPVVPSFAPTAWSTLF